MKQAGPAMKLLSVTLLSLIPSLAQAETSVWDRVKPSADLRVRYDQAHPERESVRTQYRLRGRLGAAFQVQDDLSVNFRLVTGSSSDGTSTNQTMNSGFSKKTIWFDQLYMNYTGLADSKIVAGKFPVQFYRTGGNQLIFDSDLSLEGIHASHTYGIGDHQLFVHLGAMPIDENAIGSDPILMAGQAGLTGKVYSDVKMTLGGGYYHWDKIQGQSLAAWSRASAGNTMASSRYAYKFNNIEGFVDASTNVMELPTLVFFEFVKNSGVSAEDTAWITGLQLGKGKEKGQFKASYDYRIVKKDAVLGSFTDSDYANGYTDSKGHVLGLRYATSNQTALVGTYYLNKMSVSTNSQNYNRIQLDFEAAF